MRPGSTFLARPPQADPTVEVGSELGSYKLEALVGAGAMGRVFKARHQKLGRTVAVKVLHPEYANRADVVQRFFREARIVNEINHEHIVEVTDFVDDQPGRAWCVMEFLQGESLRDALKRKKKKRLPIADCVAVAMQICDALHAAHERGVVHRDLKPDNVFLSRKSGSDLYAKVLDFGVAKLTEPIEGEKAGDQGTMEGMILGTPIYMSPEQATGMSIDRRTDVWAAGVVLYEMLSGGVPYDAQTFIELANKLVRDPVPPMPEKTPRGERIPLALAGIVLRCLRKKPDERFPTMAALGGALEALFGKKGRRRRTRSLLLPVFATAMAIVLAAGASAWFDLPRRIATSLGIPMPAALPARPEPPPPPKSPSHVEVELTSKPRGATVTRLDTGDALGKTPLNLKLERKPRDVRFRFELEGHEPMTVSVDLGTGGSAAVALRPVPPPPPKPPPPKKAAVKKPAKPTTKKRSSRR